MVQIVIDRAASAHKPLGIAPVSITPAVKADPLDMMLERIASSTRLTLAEKRSFADSLRAAFKAGDYKMVAKIMMMISRLEAQRKSGEYARHSVGEITGEGATSAKAAAEVAPRMSGTERIRQLLLS